MSWSYSNIAASPSAGEIIRATSVLQTGHAELVPIEHVHAMVDLTWSQWALGLAEILTTGVGVVFGDDENRECLFLTRTPIYAAD